jgi:hypothetical protein
MFVTGERRAFSCLGAFDLSAPTFVVAAPLCTTGSMSEYEALGAGGCTIGALTFRQFAFELALVEGTGPPFVTSDDLLVTPAELGTRAILRFSADGFSVAGDGNVIYVMNYLVDGLEPIVGFADRLEGVTAENRGQLHIRTPLCTTSGPGCPDQPGVHVFETETGSELFDATSLPSTNFFSR